MRVMLLRLYTYDSIGGTSEVKTTDGVPLRLLAREVEKVNDFLVDEMNEDIASNLASSWIDALLLTQVDLPEFYAYIKENRHYDEDRAALKSKIAKNKKLVEDANEALSSLEDEENEKPEVISKYNFRFADHTKPTQG